MPTNNIVPINIPKFTENSFFIERRTNLHNDIALLKFQVSMEISDWKWNTTTFDAIYPICLPETDYEETWKKGRNVLADLILMFEAFFQAL